MLSPGLPIPKNNESLAKLTVSDSKFYRLKNIIIENNDKLKDIDSLEVGTRRWNDFSSQLLPDFNAVKHSWDKFLVQVLNEELSLVIKHNDCLENLNLGNLNSLTELRIENNDNLKQIDLNSELPNIFLQYIASLLALLLLIAPLLYLRHRRIQRQQSNRSP